MAGYKKVNFYELCRLCASNQQRDKTHIFQEEGKKIQLLDKIQTCLSLTIHENDILPKVVCGQCLKSLEIFYNFKQECSSSEMMLSGYFKNFRYTEDFKKSGEVYIKDTTVKHEDEEEQKIVQQNAVHMQQPVKVQTYVNTNVVPVNSTPETVVKHPEQQIAQPYYALDIPGQTIQLVHNVGQFDAKTIPSTKSNEFKMANNQNHNGYGVNQHPIAPPKQSKPAEQQMSNVVVNANGEVITFGQIVDLESFISQAITTPSKSRVFKSQSQSARRKEPKIEDSVAENHYEEPSKVKQKCSPQQPTVIFPTEYSNFQPYSNSYSPNEPSTVNLNALAPDPLQTMEDHRIYHSLTKPKKEIQQHQSSEKCHVCGICQKSFKRREHLFQHIKLHTGFRPYTCENCSKSFMRKEHLLRHMTSHSGQKNFQCPVCEKSFSRNDNLMKHRKTHEKQQSFTCEVCQKQFVMRHYYLAHKMSHDMGTPNVLGILCQ